MSTVVIFNQKGGVGKTTTALNLGAGLGYAGFAPLLIDLDPQAHLSSILSPVLPDSARSIFSFYSNNQKLTHLAQPVGTPFPSGAELIPAHAELMKVDSLFGKGPNILGRLAQGIAAEYHDPDRTVLIDCCPMLGVLSLNAIFAADLLLVPISADYLAIKGALQVEKTLKALESVLRRRVERRYVVTRFDPRRKMSHEIVAELEERFGEEVCRSQIAETVSLAESPAYHRDVFAHAQGSRGAADYRALLDELLARKLIKRHTNA